MKALIPALFVALLALVPAGAVLADPVAKPVLGQQGQYNPPKPKDGFRYPDCFCTDSEGKRVELGQTSCLKIGSQEVTARCDMSLNNPTWRRVSEGCPTS